MATTTKLLDAVNANTVGTGVQITGDFEALFQGSTGGGVCELQVADVDTPDLYQVAGPDCAFMGPGNVVTIRNNVPKYYRGVLKGKNPSISASATLKVMTQ